MTYLLLFLMLLAGVAPERERPRSTKPGYCGGPKWVDCNQRARQGNQ